MGQFHLLPEEPCGQHGGHMDGTSDSFSPDQGGKEGESTVENSEVPRQDWHD